MKTKYFFTPDEISHLKYIKKHLTYEDGVRYLDSVREGRDFLLDLTNYLLKNSFRIEPNKNRTASLKMTPELWEYLDTIKDDKDNNELNILP